MKYEKCHICGSNKFLLLKKTNKYNFGKCLNCEVFYVNPVPKIKNDIAKNFYNKYGYNKNFIKFFKNYKPLFLLSLENKLKKIKSLLNQSLINRSLKFLDIGCGGGGYVYAAKKVGLDAYGIDIDKESCLFAKSLGLNIFNGEISDANYPNNFFDIIQLKQTLEHIYDPKQFLTEINRILKKNGVLIIDVPNQNGFIPKIKILLNTKNNEYGFLQPPRHLYAYTTKSLKYLLERNNFKIINYFTSCPGNPIYCPLYKQKLFQRILFKITNIFKGGSILVVYAKKS